MSRLLDKNVVGFNEDDEVILVNAQDEIIGTKSKIQAHIDGDLHRAFSIFIFSTDKTKVLLQQRAFTKYHCPGMWTNTCCSHPRKNESVIEAANRRIKEEMGMEAKLTQKFSFIYKATMENGLIEHELDYVLFGFTDLNPVINPMEVNSFEWVDIKNAFVQFDENQLTSWFKISWNQVLDYLKRHKL